MDKVKKFKRVLIANRGEIAVRIINTCKEMGIETVVVSTPPDKGSLFTEIADYCHSLDSSKLKDTYLNPQRMISIAKKFNCDAVHPGYGFLSENASFSLDCAKSSISFIGPTPQLIELMGDKIQARKTVEEIGIPLLKAYINPSEKELSKNLNNKNYPVLIKAAAGGGGRGMRIVHNKSELKNALESAASEAENAFNDKTLYVERFLENCRHIEVQVLSDSHGNHLHLFERECSIQRRHQKIIEESPSPSLNDLQRKEICDAALKITQSINYLNAGTIEFLWADDEFFFLEMNTRLQVEHPVTEQICGLDLVRLQIDIAQGQKLKIKQQDLKISGHAIEARIYAEDPLKGFLPTTGKVEHVGQHNSPEVRIETSFQSGCSVPVEYDSMIAKVSAHSSSREYAIKKLHSALEQLPFSGVKSNRTFLMKILQNKNFYKGLTFTSFIESNPEIFNNNEIPPEVIAAYFLASNSAPKPNQEISNPWLMP